MTTMHAVAIAVTFLWLGMVLAISFLEAPLKFRAPDVTVRIGLGIGRLVFGALNRVEIAWAAILVLTVIVGGARAAAVAAAMTAVVVLIVQMAGVRPWLTRRSNRVLDGEDAPRSRAHHVYVGLETVKVLALLATGVLLLGG
ncbi:hypothetical protein [Nocardia ignorata]|uniref:Transmembrane protein n=1 Tax=Nocardia ignorata TaxID=145285 RepID=A0A4R6P1G3_NOCIG|nr:hypothetical protein [Nocardia ignorata]TDP31524.1 hypothetical protein DFR75_108129 [Nocardia ignorata]